MKKHLMEGSTQRDDVSCHGGKEESMTDPKFDCTLTIEGPTERITLLSKRLLGGDHIEIETTCDIGGVRFDHIELESLVPLVGGQDAEVLWGTQRIVDCDVCFNLSEDEKPTRIEMAMAFTSIGGTAGNWVLRLAQQYLDLSFQLKWREDTFGDNGWLEIEDGTAKSFACQHLRLYQVFADEWRLKQRMRTADFEEPEAR